MDTLGLVKDLLKNYQVNMSMIKLIESQSEESNILSTQNIGILKQQMQLLKYSIDCLSEKEKKLIGSIFMGGHSLNSVAKALFTCKSNVYKMKERTIQNIAKIYEKLKSEQK